MKPVLSGIKDTVSTLRAAEMAQQTKVQNWWRSTPGTHILEERGLL